ncbi:MAG: hypothetical protein EBY80_15820 [Actinobacteria bacterium]|nr:hypothetical protein [Actinomycetota bacterium]
MESDNRLFLDLLGNTSICREQHLEIDPVVFDARPRAPVVPESCISNQEQTSLGRLGLPFLLPRHDLGRDQARLFAFGPAPMQISVCDLLFELLTPSR